MNRINKRGQEILNYKKELSNDEYPELVRNALILSVEQLVANQVVDLDTFELIKDDSVSYEEVEEYLYTRKEYLKTEEEIFKEYEVIRKDFHKKLEEEGMLGLETETMVDNDTILVIKKFTMNEEVALEYFKLKEEDLLKLMKRRGFVEKFSVLRLTAIFNRFIDTVHFNSVYGKAEVSLVYFDKEENGYSIDVYCEIPVELIESGKHFEEMKQQMENVFDSAVAYYEERMIP